MELCPADYLDGGPLHSTSFQDELVSAISTIESSKPDRVEVVIDNAMHPMVSRVRNLLTQPEVDAWAERIKKVIIPTEVNVEGNKTNDLVELTRSHDGKV